MLDIYNVKHALHIVKRFLTIRRVLIRQVQKRGRYRPQRSCRPLGLTLFAQFPNRGEVVIEILTRVVVDFVLLQQAVELIARGDSQERAELVPGDAPLPVGFESEDLQSGAAGSWPHGSRCAAKSSGRVTVICTVTA